MTALKYLIAEYIWHHKTGVSTVDLLEYLETCENISYESGKVETVLGVLEDLEIEGLISIHHGKIFIKFNDKWDEYLFNEHEE